MINIGIIGAGIHGWDHCLGFDRLSDSQILAVADPSEKQLKMSKSTIKGSTPKFFTDYKDLLKITDIDAVVIATPSYLHTQITIEALRANKDIFLEKPIAPTIESTDQIIKEYAKTDRIIQIGLEYRYSNLFRTMAQLIEKGTFGNVMIAYCKEHRENFPSPWFFDENKSGGAILDKNVHHFDIFNWLLQSPPYRVFAMGGQHVVKAGHKIQCSYSWQPGKILKKPTIVDHANVLIEYENGAKGNLGLCMYEIQPIEGLEIGIIGDNGAWALTKNDKELIIAGGPIGNLREVEVDYFSDNEGLVHIGIQAERRDFIECIKKRKQPYANLSLGREACVVSFAAEKSIKEGRIVNISEFDNKEISEIFRRLGYDKKQKTPPTFALPDSQLKLKKRKSLKSKERELKRELKRIQERIKELST
ncbi:MAG: Gfo/Idh/MocA family protein [Candidatus Hodarchaeota archaeon]